MIKKSMIKKRKTKRATDTITVNSFIGILEGLVSSLVYPKYLTEKIPEIYNDLRSFKENIIWEGSSLLTYLGCLGITGYEIYHHPKNPGWYIPVLTNVAAGIFFHRQRQPTMHYSDKQ